MQAQDVNLPDMSPQCVNLAQWRMACMGQDEALVKDYLRDLKKMPPSAASSKLALEMLLVSLELHHFSIKSFASMDMFLHNPQEFFNSCAVTNNIPAAALMLKKTNPNEGVMRWAAHYAAKSGRKFAYHFFQSLSDKNTYKSAMLSRTWRPEMLRPAPLELLDLEDGPKTLMYLFKQGWMDEVENALLCPSLKMPDKNSQVCLAWRGMSNEHEAVQFLAKMKRRGWNFHEVIVTLLHPSASNSVDLFSAFERVYAPNFLHAKVMGDGVTHINISSPREVLYSLPRLSRHSGAQQFVFRQCRRAWGPKGLYEFVRASLSFPEAGRYTKEYLQSLSETEKNESFKEGNWEELFATPKGGMFQEVEAAYSRFCLQQQVAQRATTHVVRKM